MAFTNLLYGRNGAVATITINRPDRRNALNPETISELRGSLQDAKADAQVRVIVLTGSNATSDVARARAAGAAGYVTKDQIAGELLRAILDAAAR